MDFFEIMHERSFYTVQLTFDLFAFPSSIIQKLAALNTRSSNFFPTLFSKIYNFHSFFPELKKPENVGLNLSNLTVAMIVRINEALESVGCSTVGRQQAATCCKL
jgi:hypothetical protein